MITERGSFTPKDRGCQGGFVNCVRCKGNGTATLAAVSDTVNEDIMLFLQN